MRRLLIPPLLATFALCFAPAAWAANSITELGAATVLGSVATATIAITTTSDCPAGSDIFVVESYNGTSATISSMTDQVSNTYTSPHNKNGTGIRVYEENAANIADLPSGDTITATWSASSLQRYATAYCVQGATASPLDIDALALTATSTTPSVATGTLAQASEAILGYVMIVNGFSDTFTESGGGFVSGSPNAGVSAAHILRTANQTVAATTSVTYAPTLGTSRNWVANVVSFKFSGAAGAVGCTLGLLGVGC